MTTTRLPTTTRTWFLAALAITFAAACNCGSSHPNSPDATPQDQRGDIADAALDAADTWEAVDTTTESWEWEKVVPTHAVLTDFQQEQACCPEWFTTRMGTDRGVMGGGACAGEASCVTLGEGQAEVSVPTKDDWAGVWNALLHTAAEKDALDFNGVLGPMIRPEYQVRVTAVEIEVLGGDGHLVLELKGPEGQLLHEASADLAGPATLSFPIDVNEPVHLLNWLVTGPGHVVVDEVRLVLEGPQLPLPEALFLWTYGHLYQCYDPATGWVRDRAHWPASDFSAVQTMGTFGLATALGAELGYTEPALAQAIVEKLTEALLAIERHSSGLLPHFITDGDITPGTEYSLVDVSLSALFLLLARDTLGLDGQPVRELLQDIDWALLCDDFDAPCSHGFIDPEGDGLFTLSPFHWSHFGSEAFLVCTALAASTGQLCVLEELDPAAPQTDDGSGFNELLIQLAFPMQGTDAWGVDWPAFGADSFARQLAHPYGSPLNTLGLFGLSACEVPEPCCAAVDYGAWGTGGLTVGPNDGSDSYGSVILAPHYAALVLADHPAEAEPVWSYLMTEAKRFTPLNNVESLAFGAKGSLQTNASKLGWNTSLVALAAARAIFRMRDIPYSPHERALADPFLGPGYQLLVE